ncbi:MAG: DUF305 domain-containing protein [Gemmatimonadota bacterium]
MDGEGSVGEDHVAQGPLIVQAGAPGDSSRMIQDVGTIRTPEREVIPPDIRFTEYMIEHHLQALEMADLVPDRTGNEQIRLLAERIDTSQEDEIRIMRRWLDRHASPEVGVEEHGPTGLDHHAPGAEGEPHEMPGILTSDEMALLASASGEEFDRLFLELMIQHHEGAILMVEELFSTPGAGQEPELYQFASHVESDQAIEIGRMQRMLIGLR